MFTASSTVRGLPETRNMEEQWSGTAEAARDLHRTLLTSQTQITTSRTLDLHWTPKIWHPCVASIPR